MTRTDQIAAIATAFADHLIVCILFDDARERITVTTSNDVYQFDCTSDDDYMLFTASRDAIRIPIP